MLLCKAAPPTPKGRTPEDISKSRAVDVTIHLEEYEGKHGSLEAQNDVSSSYVPDGNDGISALKR
jgi:hypothetical protein